MARPNPEFRQASRRSFLRAVARGLWLVAAGSLARSGTARAEASAPEFRIVVHRDNAVATLPRAFVSDAFLKKSTRWDGGEPIQPADQRPSAYVRRRFSEVVLRRTVNAVRSYWQQRIFSGRDVPPPEFDSDEAVIGYVGSHPGGLGYVSASAKLSGVREVRLK